MKEYEKFSHMIKIMEDTDESNYCLLYYGIYHHENFTIKLHVVHVQST